MNIRSWTSNCNLHSNVSEYWDISYPSAGAIKRSLNRVVTIMASTVPPAQTKGGKKRLLPPTVANYEAVHAVQKSSQRCVQHGSNTK